MKLRGQSILARFVTVMNHNCFLQFYWQHKIILENNCSEDSVEKEVVVAVNGEESRVVFIDHQHGTMKLENLVMTYEPHAFLVVLAVDDISSLAIVRVLLMLMLIVMLRAMFLVMLMPC